MVPRVCLQYVIVAFPDHTHLLFNALSSLSETVTMVSNVYLIIIIKDLRMNHCVLLHDRDMNILFKL